MQCLLMHLICATLPSDQAQLPWGNTMSTTTITFQVDADLAEAYRSAPSADRSKLDLLESLWLRELAARTTSLTALMDDLGDKAQARGLTAEKLEEMLNDRIGECRDPLPYLGQNDGE
jgi:hypothetical protein